MEELGRFIWVWLLGLPLVLGAIELARTRRALRSLGRRDDVAYVPPSPATV